MNTLKKHLATFSETINLLIQTEDENKIRYYITILMKYLENNHLLDKNYLDNSQKFLKSEKDLELIKACDFEMLLSFLTMINRIDYVDSNSDAYMIYYKNGMILSILKQLVYLIKNII